VDAVPLVSLLELRGELELSDRESSYIHCACAWSQRLQLGLAWSHLRLVSRHRLQVAMSLACPILSGTVLDSQVLSAIGSAIGRLLLILCDQAGG
jgi:hypothetical protein